MERVVAGGEQKPDRREQGNRRIVDSERFEHRCDGDEHRQVADGDDDEDDHRNDE